MVILMLGSKPHFTNHAKHARAALTDVNIAHVHIEMPPGIIPETLASLPPVELIVWREMGLFSLPYSFMLLLHLLLVQSSQILVANIMFSSLLMKMSPLRALPASKRQGSATLTVLALEPR